MGVHVSGLCPHALPLLIPVSCEACMRSLLTGKRVGGALAMLQQSRLEGPSLVFCLLEYEYDVSPHSVTYTWML